MSVSLRFCRLSLLTSAALLVAVALVVAAGVIPPVKDDTFPAATPEGAVPAFWVNVVFNVLVAAVLLVAIRAMSRRRISTILLVLLAVVALLLGFALTDAALAYRSHGPAMHTTVLLLCFCSAADLLAGALALTTALLLPKQTGK